MEEDEIISYANLSCATRSFTLPYGNFYVYPMICGKISMELD